MSEAEAQRSTGGRRERANGDNGALPGFEAEVLYCDRCDRRVVRIESRDDMCMDCFDEVAAHRASLRRCGACGMPKEKRSYSAAEVCVVPVVVVRLVV